MALQKSAVQQAIKEGFSPDEIINFAVSQDEGFAALVERAKRNNYSNDEIVNFLTGTTPQKKQQAEGGEQKMSLAEPSQLANKVQTGAKELGSGLKGAGKQLLRTTAEAAGLGEKFLRGTLKTILPKGAEQKLGLDKPTGVEALGLLDRPELTPKGRAEEIGAKVAEVGTYVLPIPGLQAGKATLLNRAAQSLPKFIGKKTAIKAGVEAAEFSGRTAVLTGGDTEETEQAAKVAGGVSVGLSVAGAALSPLGKAVSSILGQFIGKSPEQIALAFSSPKLVNKYIKQGIVPLDVRQKIKQEVGAFSSQAGKEYETGVEALQKLIPSSTRIGGISRRLNVAKAKKMMKEAIDDTVSGLPRTFREFSIGIKKGVLDFEGLQSSVVRPAERKTLQRMYDTILQQTDFTPKGIDRVAQKLQALGKYQFGGQTITSAAATSIASTYRMAIKGALPQLYRIRQEYSVAKEIASGVDDIIKTQANINADPGKVTTAAKKLSNLYNEDNDAYLAAIQRFEQKTGQDFLLQLAATEFKDLVPRKFGSKVAQAGLLTSLVGGVLVNPYIFLALPLFSPRFVGKAAITAGRVAPAVEPVIEAGARATVPLTE